jgi:hypothetical protein
MSTINAWTPPSPEGLNGITGVSITETGENEWEIAGTWEGKAFTMTMEMTPAPEARAMATAEFIADRCKSAAMAMHGIEEDDAEFVDVDEEDDAQDVADEQRGLLQ